jgi:opacity protein-like surface antigen
MMKMRLLISALICLCLVCPVMAQTSINLDTARRRLVSSEKLLRLPKRNSSTLRQLLSRFRLKSESEVASRAKSYALAVPPEFRPDPLPQFSGGGDFPRSEFYLGYAFTSLDPGTGIRDYFPANGWNAAVTGNFNSWFGLVGDFSGAYGEKRIRSVIGITLPRPATADYKAYTLLAGPQFSARGARVTGFARVMAGVMLREYQVRDSLTQSLIDENDDSAFALGIGGGVDAHLSERVSWRVAQFDYVMTRFQDFENTTFTSFKTKSQHHFKISSGLVFR